MKFRKNKEQGEQEEKRNLLKEKMNKQIHVMQSAWAQWMLRRTRNIPAKRMRLILIVFVMGIGSYCAWLTYAGINGKSGSFFSVTPIKKPAHATVTDDRYKVLPGIAYVEYQRIHRFRIYMDSLARSATGKNRYDSIIRHRPGLMDSIGFIENYYEQLKK